MIAARVPAALARLTGWTARRPRAMLAAALAVLVLSILALSRIHISGSLSAMLGAGTPSAEAMERVTGGFSAADELLVLVEDPDLRRGVSGPASMLAFAQRLQAVIAAAADSSRLVAGVSYTRDPAYAEYPRRVMAPAAGYYVSDAAFADLLQRLTPESMREQLARNETLIAAPGPAGDAISRAVLRDPLRLAELVPAEMGGLDTGESADNPPELSDDGSALLVRIAAATPARDLDAARTLIRAAEGWIAAAAPGPLRVSLGGSHAIAATTSAMIRADSIVSTAASVVLLYVLFAFLYRRALTPVLIGAVAGLGMVAGFGVHALAAPTISPLSAVIAAMIAGLGVDYAIHFISSYDAARAEGAAPPVACEQAARHVGLPVVTNAFTSVFGFLSLMPSQIQMLRDFAVMGTLGLLGALVAVFLVLPPLLVVTDRRAPSAAARPLLGGLAAGVARRSGLCMAAAVVLLVAAVGGAGLRGFTPQLEDDLTVLHPRPNPALDTTAEITRRFASHGELMPVEIRADSPSDLAAQAHAAARALQSPACRDAGVVGVLGLHLFVPDPATTPARRERLALIDPVSVVASFDAAIAESAFNPDAYTGYRDFLRDLATPRAAPTVQTLLKHPALAERIFPRTTAGSPPTSTVLLVQISRSLDNRDAREQVVTTLRTALAPHPHATLAGMSAVAYDLEEATRRDVPRSIAISLVLVLIWLWLVLGRARDVGLALIPLLFAGVCTVGFMIAFRRPFNPVNAVALPLLDGIAVDAGVFLVAAARRRGPTPLVASLGPTCHAVVTAALTTITGFAALCFTRTPAIRSLGFAASLGIAAALAGALLLLLPLLLRHAQKEES